MELTIGKEGEGIGMRRGKEKIEESMRKREW